MLIFIIFGITNLFKGSDKNNNTVIVSSKDTGMESAKAWAQNMSDKRKEYLTRKSNEANQFLSKKLGQPLRDIKNKLSDKSSEK